MLLIEHLDSHPSSCNAKDRPVRLDRRLLEQNFNTYKGFLELMDIQFAT